MAFLFIETGKIFDKYLKISDKYLEFSNDKHFTAQQNRRKRRHYILPSSEYTFNQYLCRKRLAYISTRKQKATYNRRRYISTSTASNKYTYYPKTIENTKVKHY